MSMALQTPRRYPRPVVCVHATPVFRSAARSLTLPDRKHHVFKSFVSMLRNDEGATLVEYSLVVALIAVACIAAITALGGKVTTKLNTAANAL